MFALLFTAFASLATGADAREAVMCAEVSFSRAAERRDREAFTALLDADARFVADDVRRGPGPIAEAWAPFFEADGPEIRWRPAIVEVSADGALALSRGPYRVRGRDADGAPTEAWGTFNSVWRRGPDGAWKVLFDAGGDHGKQPTDDERRILEEEPDCS